MYLLLLIATIVFFPMAILLTAALRQHQLLSQHALLSDAERERAIVVLVDKLASQARDKAWLESFVDAYFHSAKAAKQDAFDRCTADADYLRKLLLDDLNRAADEHLVQQLAAEESGALGFSAEERWQQYRDSQHLFTPRQVVCALLGVAALTILFLFPPWIRLQDVTTNEALSLWGHQDYYVKSSQFLGYRPARSSAWPPDKIAHRNTGFLGKHIRERDICAISMPILTVQLLMVVVLTMSSVWNVRSPAAWATRGHTECGKPAEKPQTADKRSPDAQGTLVAMSPPERKTEFAKERQKCPRTYRTNNLWQ